MVLNKRETLRWPSAWCLAFGLLGGCYSRPESKPTPAQVTTSVGETTIHVPKRLTYVEVATASGSAWIPCQTCHSLRAAAPVPNDPGSFKEFHVGMTFDHGNLNCGACHAEGQPPSLRLADGTRLEMVEAMRLCGQCHGQQLTNFQHAAHGGMRGNWDVKRGNRQRNHCVDCHDPHQPALPKVMPKSPPRDRFLAGGHP